MQVHIAHEVGLLGDVATVAGHLVECVDCGALHHCLAPQCVVDHDRLVVVAADDKHCWAAGGVLQQIVLQLDALIGDRSATSGVEGVTSITCNAHGVVYNVDILLVKVNLDADSAVAGRVDDRDSIVVNLDGNLGSAESLATQLDAAAVVGGAVVNLVATHYHVAAVAGNVDTPVAGLLHSRLADDVVLNNGVDFVVDVNSLRTSLADGVATHHKTLLLREAHIVGSTQVESDVTALEQVVLECGEVIVATILIHSAHLHQVDAAVAAQHGSSFHMAVAQGEVVAAVVDLNHVAVLALLGGNEAQLVDGDIGGVVDEYHALLVARRARHVFARASASNDHVVAVTAQAGKGNCVSSANAGNTCKPNVLGIGTIFNLEGYSTLNTTLQSLSGLGKGVIVGVVAGTNDVVALEARLDGAACGSGSDIGVANLGNLSSHSSTNGGIGSDVVGEPQVVVAIVGNL